MSLPMIGLPTIRDIMAFHNVDRLVYEKIVMHGIHLGLAREIVCLLIWLDHMTVVDVPCSILSFRNPSALVVSIAAEAEAILHYLQQNDSAKSFMEFPCLANLLNRCMDTNFFDIYKDRILKAITHKINGVGRVIFDDYFYEILHAYETNVKIADQEASRWGRRAMPPAFPAELIRPYHLTPEITAPEDDRSIFLNPLAEGVMDFFVN
jgi:hypothetical protein